MSQPSRNLSIVQVRGGRPVVNLVSLVDKKVHEYLLVNCKMIYSASTADVVVPNVGTFYSHGVGTFIVTELTEAIINVICYNVVIRSKNNEVPILVALANNSDLFISQLVVSYQADYQKLVDMLINNETQMYYRDARSGQYRDDGAVLDYVDLFSTNILTEIYALLKYILATAKQHLIMLIIEIEDQIGADVEQLFKCRRLADNLRTSSVFVNYKTYDIMILNQ